MVNECNEYGLELGEHSYQSLGSDDMRNCQKQLWQLQEIKAKLFIYSKIHTKEKMQWVPSKNFTA